MSKAILLSAVFLSLFLCVGKLSAQEKLPTIKSNSDLVSIQDGDEFRKDAWRLSPETKPDVYQVQLPNGKPKKVAFKTDIESIDFTVEEGKKYDFIIQKGDALCYTQLVGIKLDFWNDKNFWETKALKTPYKPNLSDEEKIAGLSKFWSEAKYNFIYFDNVPDLDWDKEYLDFIPKVLATKSTLEYYKVLQLFCAKLKDGHTNVYAPDELDDEIYSKPAITTRLVEGRVIIIGIYDEKLKNEGLVTGQEVIEIDGMPVKKYAEEKVLPYVSDSTPQGYDTTVYQRMLLSGPLDKYVELVIKDSKGKAVLKMLPRLKWQERNRLLPQPKSFEMTMLPGNIAHVKINTMNDIAKAHELFAKNFAEISKSDALIIDLRENGGGSSGIGYAILAHLIDTPFKQSTWKTREYHPTRPWGRMEKTFGDAAFEQSLESIRKMRGAGVEPYDKPVVVLSSPRTGSAAEDFLVAFKPLKRGLIIGEPSGGSTGQPLMISLPGGGSARICTKADTFPDGTKFVGVGVIPDILATPKVSDFVEGKDSVLEVAIKELTKSLKK